MISRHISSHQRHRPHHHPHGFTSRDYRSARRNVCSTRCYRGRWRIGCGRENRSTRSSTSRRPSSSATSPTSRKSLSTASPSTSSFSSTNSTTSWTKRLSSTTSTRSEFANLDFFTLQPTSGQFLGRGGEGVRCAILMGFSYLPIQVQPENNFLKNTT